MRYIFYLVIAVVASSGVVCAQPLSQTEAINAAEKFVAEEGYTTQPAAKSKWVLALESLDWFRQQKTLQEISFNTLRPKAIGVRHERRGDLHGWSVAFDYKQQSLNEKGVCRVVTMEEDGSQLHIEHMDGIRSYFLGVPP